MLKLRRLFAPRHLAAKTNRRPAYRPHLEHLEPRLAPATVAIIDNGDGGFATVGAWTNFPNQGFQNDVTFAAAGTGSATATWTFTGLTAGATYRVSATWTAHPNRATNAPFTIINGTAATGTALATVLVDQELTPNDFTDVGAAWEHLGGPYTITGTTLTVRLTNQANEFVIADAIRVERVDLQIIDDGNTGFTSTPNFFPFANQGFQNDVHFAAAGTGSEQATWTFMGLAAGLYRVSATWTAHPNRATNAPFTIFDGTTTGINLGTVRINQELAPDDLYAAGTVWEHLGVPYQINSGTITVRLTNQANEYVIADAIRIERLIVNPTRMIDDGASGFSTVGEWTSFPGQGFQNDVTFSAAGSGADTATWTFTSLVPGTYRVSATWTAHPNRATNAPFTILDGGTVRGTVQVNQEQAPDDFTDAGTTWENLGGPYTVVSGTLTVRLSDNANEYVIADAIRVELLAENGTWFRLAPMPLARQEIASAVLNGQIYVIGGYDAALNSTNNVQVYNPVTNSWSTAAPLPIINNHGVAAVAGGNLYAFGGVSNQTFRYNPTTNTWTQVASMNFQHGETPAVAVINDRIYVAGGAGPGMTGNEVEVYDPATNTWTQLASMSVPRNHTAGGAINGLFYVVGGRDSPNADTALEVYNPATNTWSSLANMPTGRSGIGAAVINGLLYTFGGELPQLHSEVEVYNPADNTWRQLAPMPTPRHGLFSAVIGNTVYLAGGGIVQGLGPSTVNEAFVIG